MSRKTECTLQQPVLKRITLVLGKREGGDLISHCLYSYPYIHKALLQNS